MSAIAGAPPRDSETRLGSSVERRARARVVSQAGDAASFMWADKNADHRPWTLREFGAIVIGAGRIGSALADGVGICVGQAAHSRICLCKLLVVFPVERTACAGRD